MSKRHRCKLSDCWEIVNGKLVNVCSNCPEAAMTVVLGYTPKRVAKKVVREPLTTKEKSCASDFIAEEMRALRKGRWGSREQAVAVGLSRARRECKA